MFESISRSWSYALDSYGILRNNKRLVVLPMLAGIAAVLVTVSFLVPLWSTGQIDTYLALLDDDAEEQLEAGDYVVALLFYFCNYFVIVFFNSALVACTIRILNGQDAPLSYGLSVAAKRLPQIIGWALVSAGVGLLLRLAERSHKRVAAIVAAIIGMAWTALTYFVVPFIVIEGTGPIESLKRSVKTLRHTWGTALMGTFSLGLLSFLLMIPVTLLAILLIYLGVVSGSAAAAAIAVTLAVAMLALGAAATTAVDMIFKVLLFSYATGKTLPDELDTAGYGDAFVSTS